MQQYQQNQSMCAYLNYSPTHTLDDKLDPIFQHIRKRRIYNIHQLKSNQVQNDSSILKEANSFVLPIFPTKDEKIRKLQSLKVRQALERLQLDQRMQKGPPQKYSATQKVIFVSPVSKVKKHLIQTIDYKGIEQALYRKIERKTLYQEFYQTMLEKDKWLKTTHPGFFQSQTIQSQASQSTNTNNKQKANPEEQRLQKSKNNLFRTAPKKIGRRLMKSQRQGQKQKSVIVESNL